MSDPVELGFRQRVAAAFAAELDGRVFQLVIPPDTTTPLAVYRRVGQGETDNRLKTARLQLAIYDDSYTDAKRLQARVEEYLAGLRRVWLSGDGEACPVWVHLIKAFTMPDGYQAATRRRVAVSEYEIKYQQV
jgi:hypothetical protein